MHDHCAMSPFIDDHGECHKARDRSQILCNFQVVRFRRLDGRFASPHVSFKLSTSHMHGYERPDIDSHVSRIHAELTIHCGDVDSDWLRVGGKMRVAKSCNFDSFRNHETTENTDPKARDRIHT